MSALHLLFRMSVNCPVPNMSLLINETLPPDFMLTNVYGMTEFAMSEHLTAYLNVKPHGVMHSPTSLTMHRFHTQRL